MTNVACKLRHLIVRSFMPSYPGSGWQIKHVVVYCAQARRGLGGGFCRVLRFPPLLTTGWSQISHNWHKCDKQQNCKFQINIHENRNTLNASNILHLNRIIKNHNICVR